MAQLFVYDTTLSVLGMRQQKSLARPMPVSASGQYLDKGAPMRVLIIIIAGVILFFGVFVAIILSAAYFLVAIAAAAFLCLALISFALFLLNL
jgi:hypothetical protein